MDDCHSNNEDISTTRGMGLGKRKRMLSGESDVPVFIRTLYTLLNECDAAIGRWSEDGTQIVIVDPARFAAEVCPKFFRHRNFNSFTRLLNMYQFHKVQGSSQDSKLVCFAHKDFVRGQEEQLSRIQRKTPSSSETREGQPRTGVEALVTRDVWEKTNKEIDQMQKRLHSDNTTAVSTWMRKVLQLEREVRQLKEKNSQLRKLDEERAQLYAQLAAQNKIISALQTEVQTRQDHFHELSVDPMAVIEHAARSSPDPVADALETMGIDPVTVLASLGVTPDTTSTDDLTARLASMANPLDLPSLEALNQGQDGDPIAADPLTGFLDIIAAENGVQGGSLLHFMATQMQEATPPFGLQASRD